MATLAETRQTRVDEATGLRIVTEYSRTEYGVILDYSPYGGRPWFAHSFYEETEDALRAFQGFNPLWQDTDPDNYRIVETVCIGR